MKTNKTVPTYFLRSTKEFTNIPEAEEYKKLTMHLAKVLVPLEIGYYLPQPQYKKWVPNWLIQLITK